MNVASMEQSGVVGCCWAEFLEDTAMVHRTPARRLATEEEDQRGRDGQGIGLGLWLTLPWWLGLGLIVLLGLPRSSPSSESVLPIVRHHLAGEALLAGCGDSRSVREVHGGQPCQEPSR